MLVIVIVNVLSLQAILLLTLTLRETDLVIAGELLVVICIILFMLFLFVQCLRSLFW